MKDETRRAIYEMMILAVKANGGDPTTAVITICRPAGLRRSAAKKDDGGQCDGKRIFEALRR